MGRDFAFCALLSTGNYPIMGQNMGQAETRKIAANFFAP